MNGKLKEWEKVLKIIYTGWSKKKFMNRSRGKEFEKF